MSFSATDNAMMARALQLAALGRYTARPNPMVGCVLARGETIVGEGWHRKTGSHHAEVNALAKAGRAARGATAYVTLEPCSHYGRTPPCADALVKAGVRRVVCATKDPNPRVAGQGMARLEAAGIPCQSGLLAAEAERLNRGFFSRMRKQRPFVTCKMAMSVDGRTAMATGESKWITSAEARQDVQRLRARHGAIVTGTGTLKADDPSLNVRFDDWLEQQPGFNLKDFEQPLRILLDTRQKAPLKNRLFTAPGKAWWVVDADSWGKVALPKDVEQVPIACSDRHIDLQALVARLAEAGVNELLVEAGPLLAGSFFRANLIDELVVYMAPKLMGSSAQGLLHMPEISTMAKAKPLELQDIRMVGNDIRLTYQPAVVDKGGKR